MSVGEPPNTSAVSLLLHSLSMHLRAQLHLNVSRLCYHTPPAHPIAPMASISCLSGFCSPPPSLGEWFTCAEFEAVRRSTASVSGAQCPCLSARKEETVCVALQPIRTQPFVKLNCLPIRAESEDVFRDVTWKRG